MGETGLNPWKLATLIIVLVVATAGLTVLVVTKWFPSEPVRSAPAASEERTGRGGAAAHGGQTSVPAVLPASAVPPQATISDCNRYASAPPSDRDKYWEIGKDAVIGGLATAAIGAAAGAIADGGKGRARVPRSAASWAWLPGRSMGSTRITRPTRRTRTPTPPACVSAVIRAK